MAATVDGWIAYAAARGDTVPNDSASAQALVRAQDYIRHHYVSRFAAEYDEDSPNVDPAVYEAAKVELATPGFFSRTFTPSDQKVLTEVAGIKWTLTGKTGGVASDATPVSTAIEALLRPYLAVRVGVFSV